MRSIINISLPKELSQKVDSLVKKGRYSTKSEFLRDLIRDRIEEDEVLLELRKSQEEIRQGKGKVLRSLKDLR
jgi:putative addiction module CopG family antidote